MKVERCDRCMGLARERDGTWRRAGREVLFFTSLRTSPVLQGIRVLFHQRHIRISFSNCKITLDKCSEQQKTSLASDEIAPYENEQCSLQRSQPVNALWRVSNDVHACTILAGGTRSFGGFDLFSYNAIHLIANFPLWAVNLAGGIPYK